MPRTHHNLRPKGALLIDPTPQILIRVYGLGDWALIGLLVSSSLTLHGSS